MAVANSNYELIMCDWCSGRISDGGVLGNTVFYKKKKLISNELHIPPDLSPANSSITLPYVFTGDEAFALRRNFLKPFNKKQPTHDSRVFNNRLSRAKQIIEDTFGIMSSRFQIFQYSITDCREQNKLSKILLALRRLVFKFFILPYN